VFSCVRAELSEPLCGAGERTRVFNDEEKVKQVKDIPALHFHVVMCLQGPGNILSLVRDA
jgi:hypothetical protein